MLGQSGRFLTVGCLCFRLGAKRVLVHALFLNELMLGNGLFVVVALLVKLVENELLIRMVATSAKT